MSIESKKNSRKKIEVNNKKLHIILSAKKLFTEKGYENTSMDDIASHAEFSKTTLYKYFKSKDVLLSNILDTISKNYYHELLKELKNIQDTKTKLECIIRSSYQFINQNLNTLKIYFINESQKLIKNGPSAAKEHIDMHNKHEAFFKKTEELMSSVIKEAIKQKVLKDLHIEYYLALLNGTLMMYAKRRIMGYVEIEESDSIKIFLDILYNGFALKEQ